MPLSGPIAASNFKQIASESSEAERRADAAERELMEWKTAQFMESHLGEEYDALIISVQKFGFFVELTEIFVEAWSASTGWRNRPVSAACFASATTPSSPSRIAARAAEALRERGEAVSRWATACKFAPNASTRSGIAWSSR